MMTAAIRPRMRFPHIERYVAAFLSILLLMASSDGHGQTSNADAALLASAKRTMLSVNADWVVAMRTGDAHRATQAYAKDAIFVTRDGRVLDGREEIEKLVAEKMAHGPTLLEGSLDDDGLQLAGTLVYEWGHSALKWKTADGKIQSTSGHFLTVWKQMPDAHWEIIRNLTL
jgi:ketosteroid isomerase-like protein